jgi:peptide/nickel transport system substrate-binding protein
LATAAETANLNYIINNESQVGDFWGWTYDTLAERNLVAPTRFEPKLATDWEISEDKLTYTIHLRKGVTWHDFTDPTTKKTYSDVPVTAADYKFYLEVIQNPGIPCEPIRVYYKDLQEIRVLDDYTFQVIWREPYFMSESLTLELMPLPRHFYQFDPKKPEEFSENVERNRMIVGCGPWVFERWDKGKEFVFRRNEKYYAPKPPMVGRRVKVIKEANARLLALRNGEIDRVGLDADQWVSQTGDKDFEARFAKFRYSRRVYYYIGYNLRRDMFKDQRVRLALTHLVDRERILRDVYRGLGRVVTGNFFIDSPSYDPDVKAHPFDPEKAKALLAEAGWKDANGDGVLDKDGKKFEFTFMGIAHSEPQARIADILRENLAKAGILMNIVTLEWSVYTQRLDEWNYDVCSLGWSMGYDDDPYQIWHSSQATIPKASNHVGFVNAEADRIIEAARREFDTQKRIAMYRRFHRILHEEQPYTFLVTPYALVAQDKRLRNARVYPLAGMNPDAFWVPKAEQKYKE